LFTGHAKMSLSSSILLFFGSGGTVLSKSVLFISTSSFKLGPTGSSTKRCGVVKQSKHITKSKFENKFQKIKNFKNYKSITNMTARALVIIFKCNNFFPIKIGQEKIEIFTKLFDLNLKMAMFKTAIRSSIGRTKQKLGQENHFLQNSEGKLLNICNVARTMHQCNNAPAQDQSRNCS
jgi:hypothetical protein